MTTVSFYTATSLDGFIADANDQLDWLFAQDIDQAGPMNYGDFVADIGAAVMGATTYRWLLEHQQSTGEPWGYTMPVWVFTHRALPTVTGADVRFVGGDVTAAWEPIAASARSRGVWLVGGGDLAAQFAAAGHLHRIIVSIAPVMLGSGRPLFTAGYDLELVRYDRNRSFLCAEFTVRGPRTAAT